MIAPDDWQAVALVSDVHLHPEDRKTHDLFVSWLEHGASQAADALFILGDLFEVWIGDDMLASSRGAFQRECIDRLRRCSDAIPVYFMHGNRDFLLRHEAAASANMTILPDPTVLQLGAHRFVLSHGDAMCADDRDYQAFRQVVRSDSWQSDFLAKPLEERITIARTLRDASQAKQTEQQLSGGQWFDLDTVAVERCLAGNTASTMIHGHTHRAADHALPHGGHRLVLSDWDAHSVPMRAEVMILSKDGQHRRDPVAPKGLST